jgi:predicted PurR-regulated permease PerM
MTSLRGAAGIHRAARDERHRVAGWRTLDILRAVVLGIGVYYGLRLLWVASPIVLTGFLGVPFGLALSVAVDKLEELRIPRGIGAAALVLAFYGALVGVGMWVAPTLRAQTRDLRERVPEAIERIEQWVDARSDGVLGAVVAGGDTTAGAGAPAEAGATGDSAAAGGSSAVELRERIGEQLSGMTRYVRPFLSSTASALAAVLLVTFLAIYIAAEPKTYHAGLMHLFPHRARERAGEVLTATGVVLRKWLVTQLIGMVIIGAVSVGVLMLLDVQGALALGVVAGLLEFVPFIGPIIAAIPAIAMAFLDSPEKALYVAGAYLVIQQLESNLLMPLLMKQGLRLPPVITIMAQGVMALLFGFVGILVAVPLAAAVIVPVKMLYVQDVVGDQVTVAGDDEEDEQGEQGGAHARGG